MSIDCNQGTNIKLFPELCCSKGLISLLICDITVTLLVIACTFWTPIVLAGSKTLTLHLLYVPHTHLILIYISTISTTRRVVNLIVCTWINISLWIVKNIPYFSWLGYFSLFTVHPSHSLPSRKTGIFLDLYILKIMVSGTHRPRTFLYYKLPTCYLITIFSHCHTYTPCSFPYPDCSLFLFYHVALVPHVHLNNSDPPKPISTELLVTNSLVNPVSFSWLTSHFIPISIST